MLNRHHSPSSPPNLNQLHLVPQNSGGATTTTTLCSSFSGGMANTGIPYAVIDAFTDSPFKGNPAAVCLLPPLPPPPPPEDGRSTEDSEAWMASLAKEFNLSETAFLTPLHHHSEDGTLRFGLRWFTPLTEVDLCGHATLASAHFLFERGLVNSSSSNGGNRVEFVTRSGILAATKIQPFTEESPAIELDFPSGEISNCNVDDPELPSFATTLKSAGLSATSFMKTSTDDLLIEVVPGEGVESLTPCLEEVRKWGGRGVIITGAAPTGSSYDFISRFFAPNFGIDEDPVCGSAHCVLAPYWSKKLGKNDLVAYQASPRGGKLVLHLDGKTCRVRIQGQAVTTMAGTVLV